jgi:hypothetical protein
LLSLKWAVSGVSLRFAAAIARWPGERGQLLAARSLVMIADGLLYRGGRRDWMLILVLSGLAARSPIVMKLRVFSRDVR